MINKCIVETTAFFMFLMFGISYASQSVEDLSFIQYPEQSTGAFYADLIITEQGVAPKFCSKSLQNCVIQVSGKTCFPSLGSITITNTSRINALNISAYSTDSNYLNYVVQENTCSTILSSGGSCAISFYTNTSVAFLVPDVIVKGSNTNATRFNLNAIQCVANISASPASFSFAIGGATQTVTITNNGPIDANEIGVSNAPGLGVTVSGSCPSPLSSIAPNNTCQLIFTSGATIGNTTATITGTNTNTVTETITVTTTPTLSLSLTSLVLATNGIFTTEATGLTSSTCPTIWDSVDGYCTSQSRTLTITNEGPTANNVMYSIAPDLPSGTTISPANCGNLASGDTCTLTITPGSTPSTVGTNIPMPSVITIEGSNTNVVTAEITLLTYGNLYQVSAGGPEGNVFSIDDTTAITESVNGLIVATGDGPGGYVEWGSTLCDSYGDGSWLLPSICQMGFDTRNYGSGCGSQISPSEQNIQSNLLSSGLLGSPIGQYWSSTPGPDPTYGGWIQEFSVSGSYQTYPVGPVVGALVRCVRKFTS